jgi:hypothetical protein
VLFAAFAGFVVVFARRLGQVRIPSVANGLFQYRTGEALFGAELSAPSEGWLELVVITHPREPIAEHSTSQRLWPISTDRSYELGGPFVSSAAMPAACGAPVICWPHRPARSATWMLTRTPAHVRRQWRHQRPRHMEASPYEGLVEVVRELEALCVGHNGCQMDPAFGIGADHVDEGDAIETRETTGRGTSLLKPYQPTLRGQSRTRGGRSQQRFQNADTGRCRAHVPIVRRPFSHGYASAVTVRPPRRS